MDFEGRAQNTYSLTNSGKKAPQPHKEVNMQEHDAPLRQCSAPHAGDVGARCRKVHVALRQNEAVLRMRATTGPSAFCRAAVSARAKPWLTKDEHSETRRQGV